MVLELPAAIERKAAMAVAHCEHFVRVNSLSSFGVHETACIESPDQHHEPHCSDAFQGLVRVRQQHMRTAMYLTKQSCVPQSLKPKWSGWSSSACAQPCWMLRWNCNKLQWQLKALAGHSRQVCLLTSLKCDDTHRLHRLQCCQTAINAMSKPLCTQQGSMSVGLLQQTVIMLN